MRAFKMILLLTVCSLLGCGGGEPAADPSPAPEDQQQPPVVSQDDEASVSIAIPPGRKWSRQEPAASDTPNGSQQPNGSEATAAGDSQTTESDAESQPREETVKAKPGVGKKGRSLDDVEGGVMAPLVTPAKAYFGIRERLVFETQLPQALSMFKSVNGRLPQSHDEFMTQIIQANRINLPELPSGQKYVWDPDKGELMIERPPHRRQL